jgi:type II secretory pathway pseudopilin PulG
MKTSAPTRHLRGFSLTEVIVLVAISGIMSFVAIVSFRNVKVGTEGGIAREVMETMNLGLKKFAQINYEIALARDDAATTDEFLVLRSLQWRDPVDPTPGSPYVRADLNPTASSNTKDYRIRWNGRVFTLVTPGNAGNGMKVDFQAGDYGAKYNFPAGYAPVR